jgi:hypothetical protein
VDREHRTSAAAVLKMMMQPCKTLSINTAWIWKAYKSIKKKENGEFPRHQVTSN